MAMHPWSRQAIWVLTFAFGSLALMSEYIPVSTYIYTQVGVLGIGAWTLVDPANTEATLMFIGTLVISTANDVLVISLYQPLEHWRIKHVWTDMPGYQREAWCAIVSSICNVVVKPISIYVLYKLYQEGAGGSSDESRSTVRDSSSQNPGYNTFGEPDADARGENFYVDLHDHMADNASGTPARNPNPPATRPHHDPPAATRSHHDPPASQSHHQETIVEEAARLITHEYEQEGRSDH